VLNHQKLKASQILQKIPIQKLGPWWLEKKFQLTHSQNQKPMEAQENLIERNQTAQPLHLLVFGYVC
jgi:hypothetical protein